MKRLMLAAFAAFFAMATVPAAIRWALSRWTNDFGFAEYYQCEYPLHHRAIFSLKFWREMELRDGVCIFVQNKNVITYSHN